MNEEQAYLQGQPILRSTSNIGATTQSFLYESSSRFQELEIKEIKPIKNG
jgi:hypothetical protein